MGLSDLEDCIKRGLLRKMPGSKTASDRSLRRAGSWLLQAEGAFKSGLYDSCILAAYETMFHAARAVLLRDGYRERSHYCVTKYIEEAYAMRGMLDLGVARLLNNYRELRHDTAYGLEVGAEEQDARNAVKDAKVVLDALERLLSR